MKPRRWQDWVNVVLGVWLIASPWVLDFAGQRTASIVAWTVGAAVVLFAGMGAYLQKAWEEAITLLLGLALMGAPWVFNFANQDTATTNVVTTGVLVVLFAIWAMLRDMDIKKLKEENRQAPGTR
jgi:hypothetical protein